MAITDYDGLKAAISSFMERNDVDGYVDDFIDLAEARLCRELRIDERDVILQGVADSRVIDITSLDLSAPIALFLIDTTDNREYQIPYQPDGSFPYAEISGYPTTWTLENNDEINFDKALQTAWQFRFRYRKKFALSDDNPTNELLTDHPDIYLCACIVWGGMFTADDQMVASYSNPLAAFMNEQKKFKEREQRGQLKVDKSLTRTYNTGYYRLW